MKFLEKKIGKIMNEKIGPWLSMWNRKIYKKHDYSWGKQGGNSKNFMAKFVRFFVTLRCFYRVIYS